MATVYNTQRNGRERGIEDMIRVFRKECEKENLLSEFKNRRYFISKSREKHLVNKKIKHRKKTGKFDAKETNNY